MGNNLSVAADNDLGQCVMTVAPVANSTSRRLVFLAFIDGPFLSVVLETRSAIYPDRRLSTTTLGSEVVAPPEGVAVCDIAVPLGPHSSSAIDSES
jgi:hypothetical protein